jgi:hypothetical protein
MHFACGFCDGNSLVALRYYQRRYSDRRQPYRRVQYLKRCIVIWEKQALSWRMYVLALEFAMCNVRRMCWISYMITHQPADVTFLLQQDDHGVLCLGISCIIFMYNESTSVAARGQTFPSTVLSMAATQYCAHPQFLCRMLWTDKAVFPRSGVHKLHKLHNLHVWTTEIPHANHHSSFQHRFSGQRLSRTCRRQRNRTACNTGSSRCSAVRRFYWRKASASIGQCAFTCAREHVVSTRRYLSLFYTSSAQLAWQHRPAQV